jgi:hypothetical protein
VVEAEEKLLVLVQVQFLEVTEAQVVEEELKVQAQFQAVQEIHLM